MDNEFLKFDVIYDYTVNISQKGADGAAKDIQKSAKEIMDNFTRMQNMIDHFSKAGIKTPNFLKFLIAESGKAKAELTKLFSDLFSEALGQNSTAEAGLRAAKLVDSMMSSVEKELKKGYDKNRKIAIQEELKTQKDIEKAVEERKKLARKRPELERRVENLKVAGVDTSLIDRQLKDLDKQMNKAASGKGSAKELNDQWSKVNETVRHYYGVLGDIEKRNKAIESTAKHIADINKSRQDVFLSYGRSKDVRLNPETQKLEHVDIKSDEYRRELSSKINEDSAEKLKLSQQENNQNKKNFNELIKQSKIQQELNVKLIQQEEELIKLEEDEAMILYKLEKFKTKDYSSEMADAELRALQKNQQQKESAAIKKDQLEQRLFTAELRRLDALEKAEITSADKKIAIERAVQIQLTRMKRTKIDSGMKPGIEAQASQVLHMAQDPSAEIKDVNRAYLTLINTIKQATEVQKNEHSVLQEKNNAYQGLRKALYDVQNVTNTGIMYFGAFSAAIIGTFKKITDVFGEFESSINRFKAVTFTGDMEQTISVGKEFSKTVLEISKNSKFTATELADAGVVMAKLGFSAKEVQQALKGVALAAESSGESIDMVAEVISGVIQGFGMTADKAEHVANVLTASALRSATDFKTLGESFKYIAPLARSTGQSFEETAGILSILGKNMVLSSQGGTTMRQALLRLTNLTPEAKRQMDILGLSVKDSLTGKFKPLIQILTEMSGKMSTLSNTTRMAALSTIFGERAVTGMSAALNEIGSNPEAVKQLIAYHQEADKMSLAARVQGIAFQGVSAEIKKLQANFQALMIEVGDKIAPQLIGIVSSLKGLVNVLKDMPTGFIQFLSTITIGLGTFSLAIAGAMASIKFFAGALQSVLVLKTLTEALKSGTFLTVIFGNEMAATAIKTQMAGLAATYAAGGFGALALSLAPIALILLGVTAVVAAWGAVIYENLKAIDKEKEANEAAAETIALKNRVMRESIELNKKEALGIQLTSAELRKQAGAYAQKANALKQMAQAHLIFAENELKQARKPLDWKLETKAEYDERQRIAEEQYRLAKEQVDKINALSDQQREKSREKNKQSAERNAYEELEIRRTVLESSIQTIKRAYEEAIDPETKKKAQDLLNKKMEEYKQVLSEINELDGKGVLSAEEQQQQVEERYKYEKLSLDLQDKTNSKNKTLVELLKDQNDERQKALDLERQIAENEMEINLLREKGVDVSKIENDQIDLTQYKSSESLKQFDELEKKRKEALKKQQNESIKNLHEAVSKQEQQQTQDLRKGKSTPSGTSEVYETMSGTGMAGQTVKTASSQYQGNFYTASKSNKWKKMGFTDQQIKLFEHRAAANRKSAPTQAQINQALEKEDKEIKKEVLEALSTYESNAGTEILKDLSSPSSSYSTLSSGGQTYVSRNPSVPQELNKNAAQNDENIEKIQNQKRLKFQRDSINKQIEGQKKVIEDIKSRMSTELTAQGKDDLKKMLFDAESNLVKLRSEQIRVEKDIETERRRLKKESEEYQRSLIEETLNEQLRVAESTFNTEIDDIKARHELALNAINEEERKKKEAAEAQLLTPKEIQDRLAVIKSRAEAERKRLEIKTDREIALKKLEEERRVTDLIMKGEEMRIASMPDSYKKSIAQIELDLEKTVQSLNDQIFQSDDPKVKEALKNLIPLEQFNAATAKQKALNEETMRQIEIQKQITQLRFQQNTLMSEFIDISSSVNQTKYRDSLKDVLEQFNVLTNKPKFISSDDIKKTAQQFQSIINLDKAHLAEIKKQKQQQEEISKQNGISLDENIQYQQLLIQEIELEQKINNSIETKNKLTNKTFLEHKKQTDQLSLIKEKFDQINGIISELQPTINSIFDGALSNGISNLTKMSSAIITVGQNLTDLNAKMALSEANKKEQMAQGLTGANSFFTGKGWDAVTSTNKLKANWKPLSGGKNAGNEIATPEQKVDFKSMLQGLSGFISQAIPVVGAFAPVIIEGLNLIATTWNEVFSPSAVRKAEKHFRDIEGQVIDSISKINEYLYNKGDISAQIFNQRNLESAFKKYDNKLKDFQSQIQDELDSETWGAIGKSLAAAGFDLITGNLSFSRTGEQVNQFNKNLKAINQKKIEGQKEIQEEYEQEVNRVNAEGFAREAKNRTDLLSAQQQLYSTQAQIKGNPELIAKQDLAKAELDIQKQKDAAMEQLIKNGWLQNARAVTIWNAEMEAIHAQEIKNAIDYRNKLLDIDNEYFNKDQSNKQKAIQNNRNIAESERQLQLTQIELQTNIANINNQISKETDDRKKNQLIEERNQLLADGLFKIKEQAHEAVIQLQLLNLEMTGVAASLTSGQIDDALNSLSQKFVGIDENIRKLQQANPGKDFSQYRQDQRLLAIREANKTIFDEYQQDVSAFSKAELEKQTIFGETEATIIKQSKDTTQEQINNLEFLKVQYGENSKEYQIAAKETDAAILKSAKQRFDAQVQLMKDELDVFSNIENLKAQLTNNKMDEVLANLKASTYSNALDQFITKQQLASTTDPKKIAQLNNKLKELSLNAQVIEKQALASAGDTAINQLEEIKNLRQIIYDSETKVYQDQIKNYQRQIDLNQRDIDLQLRKKKQIEDDIAKQQKQFDKNDLEEFKKAKEALNLDKELRDALEYVSNPSGVFPVKVVDGKASYQPTGQIAMEAGNKRAEVMKAQAESQYMLEQFDPANAAHNAELYYAKLAEIAAQKAVFGEYIQKSVQEQHIKELARLTELGKTEDELRVVKNRQKEEEVQAIMYTAQAYKDFQDARKQQIANQRGDELQAIQDVVDERTIANDELKNQLDDAQWEVTKAGMKMANDLKPVDDAIYKLKQTTGQWQFTLNQVATNIPALVTSVISGFEEISTKIKSQDLTIPVDFPQEFKSIVSDLKAILPRLPDLVNAQGSYKGQQVSGSQNTSAQENTAVTTALNKMNAYDVQQALKIKQQMEDLKQYVYSPMLGSYVLSVPPDKQAEYNALQSQLSAYPDTLSFAQGGKVDNRQGGNTDYIHAMLRAGEVVAPEQSFRSLVQDWVHEKQKRGSSTINNGGNTYQFAFGNVYGVDDLTGTIKNVIRDVNKQDGYYNSRYTVNSN